MHRLCFSSAIVLAIFASSARAQTPAGPQPDGRRLRLSVDSLDVYVVQLGQSRRTGFLVDRLDTVRVDGETMLRRIRRTADAMLGNSVDTLVHALATLQPRSVRSYSDRGTERLDWQTSRVVGVVEEPESLERTIDSPLPGGWYSSASFDLILRACPLADGYGVAVPTFSGHQGSHVLTAKVTGSEDVEGHGETWRVEADFAGLPVTFWISKSSRRLVRQILHVSPVLQIMFVAPTVGRSA
ncbi:MAG TPA: hypothetical protein VNC18_04360 [Gemmatimonadaceae bacterium]|jgi:hypothetical protein|nr:hypothetical protein [Gemmatimonadaceae bacterium]